MLESNNISESIMPTTRSLSWWVTTMPRIGTFLEARAEATGISLKHFIIYPDK